VAAIQKAKAALIVLAASLFTPAAASEFEPDIQSLLAAQTVPAKWLRSSDYVVDSDVINHKFMNHYRVGSRFGVFSAIGIDELFVRIREIEALETLREMSGSRLIVESAGDTITDTVKNVGDAVDDPSGAAQDLGSGFSRLMKRLGRMSRNAFEKAKNMIGENTREEEADETGISGAGLAKGFLGVNRAYRELARELRVDPYTRNATLRAEIEKLASYSAAGAFGVRTIVPVLPILYGAGYLMAVSDLVYGTHPLDLQLQNEASLREMGVSNRWIRRLMESDRHTLTTQTRIVTSLERMRKVRGKFALVRVAALAQNNSDALFFTRMIELLSIYHEQRSPLQRIVNTDRVPFALLQNGRAVVVAPFDYFRWTKRGKDFVLRLQQHIGRADVHREIWITGQVSPPARRNLGSAGWAVFDQAATRI
jgi:hypothetical protein